MVMVKIKIVISEIVVEMVQKKIVQKTCGDGIKVDM